MEKSTHSGLATRPIEGTAPQPAKSPNRDSGYGKDVKGNCLEIYVLNKLKVNNQVISCFKLKLLNIKKVD